MNMTRRSLFAALLSVAPAFAHAGAVVVAKGSELPAMDADEARRVFLGLQRAVGGQAISLVLFQTYGPQRSEFELKVLGKSGAELNNYMTMLIFTGRALPPKEIRDDNAVKAFVNENSGAVGYVSDEAVDDTVKVLFRY